MAIILQQNGIAAAFALRSGSHFARGLDREKVNCHAPDYFQLLSADKAAAKNVKQAVERTKGLPGINKKKIFVGDTSAGGFGDNEDSELRTIDRTQVKKKRPGVNNSKPFILLLVALAACHVISCAPTRQLPTPKEAYTFYGGPAGGKFMLLAMDVSQMAEEEGWTLRPMRSKGSYENLRLIDANKADFAIVFASQLHRALNGTLKNDTRKYGNIRVLGYLYGYSAHLLVQKDSGIFSARQLKGKRVSVGRVKSGTRAMAGLLFKHLGIWDDIHKDHLHSSRSWRTIYENGLDAIWIMSDFPNRRIVSASEHDDIRLLDLQSEGLENGFFETHPYFTPTIVPSGTYPGIYQDTQTYEDSALLIANKQVPDRIARQLVAVVYSPETMDRLASKSTIFRHMRKNDGNFGITLPIHEGAKGYYADKAIQAKRVAAANDALRFEQASGKKSTGYGVTYSSGHPGRVVQAGDGGMSLLEYCRAQQLTSIADLLVGHGTK